MLNIFLSFVCNFSNEHQQQPNSLLVPISDAFEQYISRELVKYYLVYLKNCNLTKVWQLLTTALSISTQVNHPDQFKCLDLLSDINLSHSKKASQFEQKAAYISTC